MKTIASVFSVLITVIPGVIAQNMKILQENQEFCTPEDFRIMPKIDAHCHIETDRTAFMEQALTDHFSIVTINTDAGGNLPVDEQQRLAVIQHKAYPEQLVFLATFSMKKWGAPGWQEYTLSRIEEALAQGAAGVKVWKNIGMVEKDRNGKFIMIDDPGFDPIFEYLEEKGLPVCGHLGEPRNCWLPVDSMTVNNDRSYFKEHPEYHMFLHPDFPSYEDQIRARDNMLKKHPGLLFIGAHMGSLEWSVDELARRFDLFPEMTVDLAARICHIQKQSQDDRQKVRDFIIRYQDRFLYGTDLGDDGDSDPAQLKARIHEVWSRDWKYFTTEEIMNSSELDGEFMGLRLPRDVVEKIYYRNAAELYFK
jgi:predicted TIM-barrel fold metal-dependent hydrolase